MFVLFLSSLVSAQDYVYLSLNGNSISGQNSLDLEVGSSYNFEASGSSNIAKVKMYISGTNLQEEGLTADFVFSPESPNQHDLVIIGYDSDDYAVASSTLTLVVGGCQEEWECFEWSSCISNSQTRTCVDNNFCGTNYDEPVQEQYCEPDIPGCTDYYSNNYDDSATINDGSCEYDIYGCMDIEALNYDPNVNINDSSCEYEEELADDECSSEFDVSISGDPWVYKCFSSSTAQGCKDGVVGNVFNIPSNHALLSRCQEQNIDFEGYVIPDTCLGQSDSFNYLKDCTNPRLNAIRLMIIEEAEKENIDPLFAQAVACVETKISHLQSNGEIQASGTGSLGIFQVTETTARSIENDCYNEIPNFDIYDEYDNIVCGLKIMNGKDGYFDDASEYLQKVPNNCPESEYPEYYELYSTYSTNKWNRIARAYNSMSCRTGSGADICYVEKVLYAMNILEDSSSDLSKCSGIIDCIGKEDVMKFTFKDDGFFGIGSREFDVFAGVVDSFSVLSDDDFEGLDDNDIIVLYSSEENRVAFIPSDNEGEEELLTASLNSLSSQFSYDPYGAMYKFLGEVEYTTDTFIG